jgi:hypothetical protein
MISIGAITCRAPVSPYKRKEKREVRPDGSGCTHLNLPENRQKYVLQWTAQPHGDDVDQRRHRLQGCGLYEHSGDIFEGRFRPAECRTSPAIDDDEAANDEGREDDAKRERDGAIDD